MPEVLVNTGRIQFFVFYPERKKDLFRGISPIRHGFHYEDITRRKKRKEILVRRRNDERKADTCIISIFQTGMYRQVQQEAGGIETATREKSIGTETDKDTASFYVRLV